MSLSSLFFSFNEFFIFMSPCDEGILIYGWTIEKMGFNLRLQKTADVLEFKKKT